MTTPFGRPFEQPTLRSIVSTLIIEPTLGFDVSHAATNLPLGATPNSDNFIMREGRLEPRPTLSQLTDALDNAHPESVAAAMNGGIEIVSVNEDRYILCAFSGRDSLEWLLGYAGTWFPTEIAGSGGAGTTGPNAVYPDMWDFTQAYYDVAEENAAIGVPTNRQGMYVWTANGLSYSTLTGGPGAACVATFDHYVLAGNVQEGGDTFIQRIRWCDRGSISSWTGGLSGYDDLLGAKGGVNRLIPLDNRIAVFFDDEIWMGMPVDFPSTFRFIPFDQTLGSPYPRSVTNTPKGPMFMARNFQLYLLPKEGGSPVPVGQPIHRSIRDTIIGANKAFGVYDGIRDMYQFNYCSRGSGSLPHDAVWLDLNTGAWAPQSYASGTGAGADVALTFGFQANLPTSRSTSWDDMDPITWNAETRTYDDLRGIGSERQSVIYGSSAGTVYQLNSRGTNDDGNAVFCAWETKELGDEWPGQQKTITRVQADYAAVSSSTVTVRPLVGDTYSTGTLMQLPASSRGSQGDSYHYAPSRYAAVRFESEAQRDLALKRFYVTMRVGGR